MILMHMQLQPKTRAGNESSMGLPALEPPAVSHKLAEYTDSRCCSKHIDRIAAASTLTVIAAASALTAIAAASKLTVITDRKHNN